MMALETIVTCSSLQQKLENAGYETLEELKKVNLIQLSKDLQLTKEEVETVMTITNKNRKHPVKSMAERIAQTEQNIRLSGNMDRLLERGIPTCRITEICGESGTGKTQICMQLAVNVQLAVEQGGLDGECIYIDTEGSFLASRLMDLAQDYEVLKIAQGIHVFRVLDYIELIALVRQLPQLFKAYPKTRLIILDSIAYHFRLNVLDMKKRTLFVNQIAQTLLQLANVHSCAAVVTNHVTMSGIDKKWMPSLSPSWGHWCANRVFLYRQRHSRFGLLFKTTEDNQQLPAQFCVKSHGISDPVQEQARAAIKEESEDNMLPKDDAWQESLAIKLEEEMDAPGATSPALVGAHRHHPAPIAEPPEHHLSPHNGKRLREDGLEPKGRKTAHREENELCEEDLDFLMNVADLL
ncbi:P-loop containing nucleoside triphosphate hydrolase protein [Sporodiniella umbellata]|nr:P-loop containing nucleoside triphosphate hydrolase protein [Sporodiniella umbellata]